MRDPRYSQYDPSNIMGDGGEWAAITTHDNENLDWFSTMREAKDHCEFHAQIRSI